MAPANRKTLAERSAGDQRLRKGLPSIAEMAQFFASEDAAIEYLLARDVLTVPNCTTCGVPCLRKAHTWIYRCQRHKYSISLVSLSVNNIGSDYIIRSDENANFVKACQFVFFTVQIWGSPSSAYIVFICK